MVVPKAGDTNRLVADNRAVNGLLDAVPWPPPSLEQMAMSFEGANVFAAVDLLQMFWQMPVNAKYEESFTMGHIGKRQLCRCCALAARGSPWRRMWGHRRKAGIANPHFLGSVVHGYR